MKERIQDFRKYTILLCKQYIVFLFSIPSILDVIALYIIPEGELTEIILSVPLFVKIGLLIVGVIWASYRVYKQQEIQLSSYKEKYLETLEKQPKLQLLFIDKGISTQKLIIDIDPYLPQPDYDELFRPMSEKIAMPFIVSSEPILIDREKLKSFFIEKYQYDLVLARLRPINFVLQNQGDAFAEEIFIRVEFPDEIDIGDKQTRDQWNCSLLYPPKEPTASDLKFSFGVDVSSFDFIAPPKYPTNNQKPVISSGPIFSDVNTNYIEYTLPKLIPQLTSKELGKLFIFAKECISDKEYKINYEIYSKQLSKPINGHLTISFRNAHHPD